MRRLWDSLLGHAVQTSKIALLSYGYSQVIVLALEGVCEEGREWYRILDNFAAFRSGQGGRERSFGDRVLMNWVFLDCC